MNLFYKVSTSKIIFFVFFCWGRGGELGEGGGGE